MSLLVSNERYPGKRSSLGRCRICLKTAKAAPGGGEERAGESRYMHKKERNHSSLCCSTSHPLKKVPGLAPGGCGLGNSDELHGFVSAILIAVCL